MKERSRGGEAAERVLAEARREAAGETASLAPVIEAPDRELLRAIRRATDGERRALLRLLGRVGGRGKRVAEQALGGDGLGDAALLDLLGFLGERQPDHPLTVAFAELAPCLVRGDAAAARRALAILPPQMARAWARGPGRAAMDPMAKALEELWLAEPPLASLLLDGLAPDTPTGVLDELARLFSDSASRPLQKAIRAAFFRLEQRGLAVPSLAVSAAVATSAEAELEAHAFLSAPDHTGDQAIWVLEELSEGGYAVLQAILDEDRSLREAHAAVVVRRGFDRLVADLGGRHEVPILRIEIPIAMGIVEQAYAANPAAASPEYRGWRQAQSAARRARRFEPAPLPAEIAAAVSVERSAELLDHAVGRSWTLPRALAESAQSHLAESARSPLVLPTAEQAERDRTALLKVIETTFPRPQQRRFGRRLEGAALYLDLAGEARLAGIARATVATLTGESGGMPRIVVALFERSLELLARQQEREKESQRIISP